MKKIACLFFLLAFLFGCKSNTSNPTDPGTKSRTGIITYKCYVYEYDEDKDKWKDDLYAIGEGKADLSKDYYKYCSYNDCFGKNYISPVFEEKLGCPIEYVLHYANSTDLLATYYEYSYDGYLTSSNTFFNGKPSYGTSQEDSSGKIIRQRIYAGDKLKYKSTFSYDSKTGYINREDRYDSDDDVSSCIISYFRNQDGYLEELYGCSINNTYKYDSLGLLVTKKEDLITTTYTYNSSHQLVEMVKSSMDYTDKYSFTYDNEGFPLEIIRKRTAWNLDIEAHTKTVYKY